MLMLRVSSLLSLVTLTAGRSADYVLGGRQAQSAPAYRTRGAVTTLAEAVKPLAATRLRSGSTGSRSVMRPSHESRQHAQTLTLLDAPSRDACRHRSNVLHLASCRCPRHDSYGVLNTSCQRIIATRTTRASDAVTAVS